MNGIDHLRFGKEDYFHVSVFYAGYFTKEIENIFLGVPIRVIETFVKVWENSASISRSPKLPLVFL